AIAPTMEVVPSAVTPNQRQQATVALVVPSGTRTLRTPALLPTGCMTGGFSIDADYGGTFAQAVRDRLGRMFTTVVEVGSTAQAGAYPLVFEAELAQVGYKLGCLISPDTYVLIKGGLRALDSQGREIWRSETQSKRQDMDLLMFDPNRGLGVPASRAISALADDWLREAELAGNDRLAAALAGPAAPPAAPSRPAAKKAAAAAPPPLPPSVVPPAAIVAPAPRFPAQPVVTRFLRGAERPDDVAVIIGNADYSRQGRDIPDVKPAYADAEGMRLYATQTLGIRDGNIIFLKDATGAQMTRVFGSKDDPRGQLSDWVKPGRSRVFVYYSGHGAPGSQGGSPFLIPTDADAARIELNGYPVKTLYDNLGKLPAEAVTVVLEACFSGLSPAGSVLGKASPVFFEVKAPPVPDTLTVITAGAANQMASWDTDDRSSLFTRYFLEGMAGKADADRDGKVSLEEVDRYLKDTLTYYARRHYGRDQNAQIIKGGGR
ncbi:MAG: caspase family protein, partial [Magnetospirillum sp.]